MSPGKGQGKEIYVWTVNTEENISRMIDLNVDNIITDRIFPEVKEWQLRPLNSVYPFVFMDCIHYKVREDGRIPIAICGAKKKVNKLTGSMALLR
ncbi:MAG TPA: hypothetical protein DCZ40_10245 [Lachnospiraceae bacterium]|nr:hypothetical protein [Lachnospiraceae bacterium]